MEKIGSSLKLKKNMERKAIKINEENKNGFIMCNTDSLRKTNIWRELKQIFNEISEDIKKSEVTNKVEFKDLIMYDENENSYEILINLKENKLDSIYGYLGEQKKINDMVFYLDKPSEKYKKNLLIKLIEEMQNERKNIKNKYLYMFENFRISEKQEKKVESKKLGLEWLPEETWSKIVREFFEEYKYLSLKIKTNIEKNFENFENLFDTFSFEYMYSQNQVFGAIKSYDEIFNLPNQFFMKIDFNIIKKYNSKLINFYRIGMKAEDPYTQYLSYYHILEYHYSQVFGRDSERNKLKSVLQRYVDSQSLKNKIGIELCNYYEERDVNFSSVPKIDWNIGDSLENIKERIYDIRNSLVHSKETEDFYEPWNDEHEETLKKEIPLIRAVAELIIKNTGENINLD